MNIFFYHVHNPKYSWRMENTMTDKDKDYDRQRHSQSVDHRTYEGGRLELGYKWLNFVFK